MHLSLPEYVHVDVVDRLAAQVVAVHDDPEAVLAALFFGQPLRREKDVSGKRLVILLAEIVERGDVLLRDHQEVHGRLGRNIVEGDDLIVFINLVCGDVSRHDLAEQTIHGGSPGLDGRQCNRPLWS